MNDQTDHTRECRICMDPNTSLPLIQPCLCSGTIGFVHTACLVQWIQSSKETKCRICRSRYDLPWIKVGENFNKYLLADEMHRMGLIMTILFTAVALLVHIATLNYCLTNNFTESDHMLTIASVLYTMYALVILCLAVINLSMFSLVIQFWLCVCEDFKKWQKTHYTLHVRAA